jgi:hypothetical protein
MHPLQGLAADLEATSAQAASARAAQEAAAAMLKDALLLQDEEYTRSLQLQVWKRWLIDGLFPATVDPLGCKAGRVRRVFSCCITLTQG